MVGIAIHAIGEDNRPLGRRERRFKNERSVDVAALDFGVRMFRAISQRPLFSSPRRAAKQASDSKCGNPSQSMEPFFPTSAIVSQFPMQA